MKPDIHPEYTAATVKCACGASYETRSTTPDISISICASCHPFYTGKQKFVDEAGRIEKFMRKYGMKNQGGAEEADSSEEAAGEAGA